MKEKVINIFNEFLIVQMNHWILFTIAVTIIGLIGNGKPNMIEWLLCSIFPFLLYILRLRSNKLIAFIILHIVSAAWMLLFLSSDKIMLLVYAVYIIGYMINSIYIKIKSNKDMDEVISPVAAVCLTSAMVILQYYQGDKEWDVYYTSVLITFLGMYFIHHYLERYLRFIEVNEGTAGHMAKWEIFRSGMGAAVIYTVLTVTVLLLTANIAWLSRFVIQIKQIFMWLLSLLVKLIKTGKETTSTRDYAPPIEAMQDVEIMELKDTFWLWEVLEVIVVVVVFGFVIVVFIKNIIKLVQFIKNQFYIKHKTKGYSSQSSIDVHERCELVKDKPSKKSFFAFLSPYERIRKIYKKRVLEGKEVLIGKQEEKLLNLMTARECGNQLMMEGLSDVYEKARYSSQECTADDVKMAKLQKLSKGKKIVE